MKYEWIDITRKNGRESNQDTAFFQNIKFDEDDNVTILGICDGMGGLQDGDKVSKMAGGLFSNYVNTEMFEHDLKEFLYSPREVENMLEKALKKVNEKILHYIQEKQEKDNEFNAGTTLTAALIYDDNIYIANAGDSPCYLWKGRDKKVSLLSEIQNVAWDRYKRGIITKRDSEEFWSASHYLENYIGCKEFQSNKVQRLFLNQGDILIIGSDGAFGKLMDEEIENAIIAENLQKSMENILKAACKKGETDNQTLILYKRV